MTVDRRATEAECQATIVKAARMFGYRVHHTRPARTGRGWRTPILGDAGFPDLVIAGHGRVMFVELKRRPNRVDDDQQAWLEALGGVVVWVPDGMQAFINELVTHSLASRRKAGNDA